MVIGLETEYVDVREIAQRWNCTEQWISKLCRAGALPGAFKNGKSWLIPANVERPVNNRPRKNIAVKDGTKKLLPLPVGISNFARAEHEYYYVDKTLLIKDLLDELSAVTLFTRPRRFGKTLTMDMLRVFFEKSEQDTSIYFNKRNIWKCGKSYQLHQGRYPVIALSFKDVKFTNWQDTLEKLALVLQAEYSRHRDILNSNKLSAFDCEYYNKIMNCTASKVELTEALGRLSSMLSLVYEEKILILIDEYDTPIQQGFNSDFYDDILGFMRMLLSSGLKDNSNLFKGVLTGILRISKENLFSGLNNPTIDTVLDKKYSQYFGFTVDEIQQMAEYYRKTDKIGQLQLWYDGYKFGNTEIYNPWSVTNYFNNNCEAQAYWANTSENAIIKEILFNTNQEKSWELTQLLNGHSLLTAVNLNIIYPKIHDNPDAIYSFLLMSGYLKAIDEIDTGYYRLALPNMEIKDIFKSEIISWLNDGWEDNAANNLRKALLAYDVDLLQKRLNIFLKNSISWFDFSAEGFYHGLMLGITAVVSDKYYIKSNREVGMGRFDLLLEPKNSLLPACVMEFKYSKDSSEEQMQNLAESALKQIKEKEYYAELEERQIKGIIAYGICFSGKQSKIIADNQIGA